MRTLMQEALEQLLAAHRHGGPLVLLFDYDGTLAAIAERPELAVLPPSTRQALVRLMHLAKVEVGVLSARRLDDLRAVLALPGLYLAGSSGMELDLRGTRVEHPRASQAAEMIDRLAKRLGDAMAAYRGAWLERKRLALTIHYRQVADDLLESLEIHVAQATKDFASDVRTVQAPKAWEIAPRWGWTKGDAVRLMVADVGVPDGVILYAGDAANDAEAIDATMALGGIALGIGPHAPAAARYRLPKPVALGRFLGSLATALEESVYAADSSENAISEIL